MNEPNVPRYSQHISQLCLRLKMTAWSVNEALALCDVVHAEPGGDGGCER